MKEIEIAKNVFIITCFAFAVAWVLIPVFYKHKPKLPKELTIEDIEAERQYICALNAFGSIDFIKITIVEITGQFCNVRNDTGQYEWIKKEDLISGTKYKLIEKIK